MAKRKSRKRFQSKSKSSWVDKLFSIKKIFVLSLVITVAAFVSYNSHLSQQVAGISTTTEDYQVLTKAQYDAIVKNPTADQRKKYYIGIEIFADQNSNIYWDWPKEDCLHKDFVFTINGVKKTAHMDSYCDGVGIVSLKSCNTLELISKFSNWKLTGTNYADHNYPTPNGRKVHGPKVQVCGGVPSYGNPPQQFVDWGFHYSK